MGQDQSKGARVTATLSSEDIAKKYDKVETIENDVQVLLEKATGVTIALKEYNLVDEDQFKIVLNKFKPMQQLDCLYLIKCLRNHTVGMTLFPLLTCLLLSSLC